MPNRLYESIHILEFLLKVKLAITIFESYLNWNHHLLILVLIWLEILAVNSEYFLFFFCLFTIFLMLQKSKHVFENKHHNNHYNNNKKRSAQFKKKNEIIYKMKWNDRTCGKKPKQKTFVNICYWLTANEMKQIDRIFHSVLWYFLFCFVFLRFTIIIIKRMSMKCHK